MTAKTICVYPQKVLLTVAKTVDFDRFDQSDLKAIARDMIDTMYKARGIGLAAPQIGLGLRMFVMDTNYHVTLEKRPRVFINPVYEPVGSEKVKEEEGCLSLPGASEKVERWKRVRVTAHDLHGSQFSIEVEGLGAACVQHECDHLNGKLYITHLSQTKRKRAVKSFQKHQDRPSHKDETGADVNLDTSPEIVKDPKSTSTW